MEKRISAVILILSLLLMNLQWGSTSAQAAEKVENGFKYIIVGDSVTIYDYVGTEKNVTIPSKIENLPVTEIWDFAFYNKGLTGVTIPNTVTDIGFRAFLNNNLTNITLPKSLKNIGGSAFAGNQLKKVVIPANVENMEDFSFAANKIESVTFEQGLKEIGYFAFQDNNLKTVTIPNSVETIGYRAFANNKLTSVTIKDGVTTIMDEAFVGNRLTNLVLPDSVTKIGNLAFYDNKLTKVTIPNSVTEIGMIAFGENQLTEVTIPSSVKVIEYEAFRDNNLKKVTIPESVTKIEAWAFHNNQLTNVTIPKSVKTIEKNAFANNLLQSVTFKGAVVSIDKEAFIPQKNAGYFLGWYTNKTFKSQWNYTVKSPLTIYSKWKQVASITPANVMITNNIASDKIALKGLTKGVTYTLYTDQSLKKKLTSFTATGSSKTLTVKQVGAKAGAIYIVASKSGYLSSSVAKVSFKAEPTPALSAKNVKVTNTKKKDTIKLSGLKKGTTYIIYKDVKKKTKLASFKATSSTKTVTVKQLGKKAGKIYITAQTPGYSVSAVTTVSFSKEK